MPSKENAKLADQVQKLKREKIKAKMAKANVRSEHFSGVAAAPAIKAAEHSSNHKRKLSQRSRHARARVGESTIEQVETAAKRLRKPDTDVSLEGAYGPKHVESMTELVKTLQQVRASATKDVQKANEQRKRRPPESAYTIAADVAPLSGTLKEHLQGRGDRWHELSKDPKDETWKPSNWDQEALMQVPEEMRERLRQLFVQKQGGLEQAEEPVSKTWITKQLQSAVPGKHRMCCAGVHCQCLAALKRSFSRCAATDGMRGVDDSLVIMREYLSPADVERHQRTGQLPDPPQFCVMCDRWLVTLLVKARDTNNGNARLCTLGQLGRHSVLTDMEGEYDATCCLYSETPTMTKMYVQYADNRWLPQLVTEKGRTFVRWHEVGVEYRPGSLN